ncbi:MAG: hypothetical protein PHH60_05020 [Candidatus Margulisbacteria bacterium]|nr:hypothetical protein [Candidatus Margulisiibacteriota bacterium]
MGDPIKATINHCLTDAGVRRFQKMGPVTASKLVLHLRRSFPLASRGDRLIPELTTRGFYKGRSFLRDELPNLTIGYNFDTQECELLDALPLDRSIALFSGFGSDVNRAREMWRAYFQFNQIEAVSFLDALAEKSPALLQNALLGSGSLGRDGVRLMATILRICRDEELDLAPELVRLQDPTVLQAIKDLSLELLTDLFVSYYINRAETNEEELASEDQEVIKTVIKTLGGEKAFMFYRYLVDNEIIEASEEFDQIYPTLEALTDAINEEVEDKVDDAVAEQISHRIITTIVITMPLMTSVLKHD